MLAVPTALLLGFSAIASMRTAPSAPERLRFVQKAHANGVLGRRGYASALARLRGAGMLQNHTGMPESAEERLWGPPHPRRRIPEYTDPLLQQRIDTLQEGYAKVRHMPREGRRKLAQQLPSPRGVAALVGLELDMREGSDTEILFRQESNFLYLTGFDHPGAKALVGLGSLSLAAGECWLFVPRGDPVWVGRTETLDDYRSRYDVEDVFWIEDFDKKFEELSPEEVHSFAGTRIFGESPPPCAESAEHRIAELRGSLATVRAQKTDDEVDYIRGATEITVKEHEVMMRSIKCGDWESDAESLFRFVGHNYGARFQSYIPIVGSGPNAAALHYNDNDHKIPNDALVLVDAAAELGLGGRNGGGYTSDVTRTWPCSGKFTAQQRAVYDAVFAAQDACVRLAVVGGSMAAATAESNRALVQGLLNAGILIDGTADELVRLDMHKLFMPHSLGHSVGLDVHDPGNYNPFVVGTVITCEPGIYFYPTKLDPAYEDPQQGRHLNKTLIENEYITMGGVRIEDVVAVTTNGPDNLSGALARTADDVERLMAMGPPRR